MEEWFGRRCRRYPTKTYLTLHCSIVVPILAENSSRVTQCIAVTTLCVFPERREEPKNRMGPATTLIGQRIDLWRSAPRTLMKLFCMISLWDHWALHAMHNAWWWLQGSNIECSNGYHDQYAEYAIYSKYIIHKLPPYVVQFFSAGGASRKIQNSNFEAFNEKGILVFKLGLRYFL